MIRGRRPSIVQIGKVDQAGHIIHLHGWGLASCVANCTCHQHPTTGHLAIYENQNTGRLGLVSYRACTCCEPWYQQELRQIITDLEDITALQSPTTT